MAEDTGEYPLAKRDGNDVLVLPPLTAQFAKELRGQPDQQGYVRLSYFEAKRFLGRLDALVGSLVESDRWLAAAIRHILDEWKDPPRASFDGPAE
jgi:hypothetical protein